MALRPSRVSPLRTLKGSLKARIGIGMTLLLLALLMFVLVGIVAANNPSPTLVAILIAGVSVIFCALLILTYTIFTQQNLHSLSEEVSGKSSPSSTDGSFHKQETQANEA